MRLYESQPPLKAVLDAIAAGMFSPDEPGRYRGLIDSLLWGGDHYFLLADYASYIETQRRVDALFRQPEQWAARAIANVAGMGAFSSDRTIREYATQDLERDAEPVSALPLRALNAAGQRESPDEAPRPLRSARPALAAGRALGRPRRQHRRVLCARAAHRAVPVRCRRRARTAARLALPGHSQRHLARLPAGRRAGPGVRPARARALAARARPPLQSAQAAARPVCARDRRPLRLARRALRRRPPPSRPAGPARQRGACTEGARGRRSLRLATATGRRTRRWPTPCSTSCTSRASRCATRRAGGPARHLRRAGVSDAAIAHLQQPGRDRGQPAAGAPAPRRAAPRRAWACRNYWGYNTIGFFCPEPALCAAAQAGCRRATSSAPWCAAAARCRHRGDPRRGLQPHRRERRARPDAVAGAASTTRATTACSPHARGHYENHTGCGNTLDLRQPRVLQLVMDSLRFWAARDARRRLPLRPGAGARPRRPRLRPRTRAFFGALSQDPVLSRLKLIAEPWDVGPDGYQLGGFPAGWLEWNDRFRDTMRASGSSGAARAATSRCGCAHPPTCSNRAAAHRSSR